MAMQIQTAHKPTTTLFQTAAIRSGLLSAFSYHANVNSVSGSFVTGFALKLNTIKVAMGT